MGLFSTSSPFDTEVEKATNENNTSEDWSQIMDICDSVGNSKPKAKECLRAIVKRLNAQDPHIVLHALTLLDACSNNCGKNFHLEIASRDFEGELKKLLTRSQSKIVDKTKALLKKWAEGDFKTDPQLNLIPSLYTKLKSDGLDFSSIAEKTKHSNGASAAAAASKEEQELAKAIELSLKENKQHQSSPVHSSATPGRISSLYPSVNFSVVASTTLERRKVRALYDFEAAEDNELSFTAGDIIHILDDSDVNWWKGAKGKVEGLFPANFVTADLSVEPDHITKLEHGSKKSVQFAEEVEVKTLKRESAVIEVEIDEAKIDRLLHLLHEADPQCDNSDPAEMLDLEEQVTAMGPLIDAALEKVDRRHAQLTQLSSDLVDALNLYHTLMREPATSTYSTLPKMPPHMNVYPYPSQPPHIYNGMPAHPQTGYNPGGLPSGAAYAANMPGIPAPHEYMSHHNMPGHNITLSQQYAMPHGHHPRAGPSHVIPGLVGGIPGHSDGLAAPIGHPGELTPTPVHPQSISQGHPHPGLLPSQPPSTGHPHVLPQSHSQGPLSSQPSEQNNLPFQSQGYRPQGMQIPVQYMSTGPQQGANSMNSQPQYTSSSNGQHMI